MVGKLSFFFYFKHSNFGGLRETVKQNGLGDNIDIELSRLDKTNETKGTQCFAINKDLQAELEMPSIHNGSDMLQGKFFTSNVLVDLNSSSIVVLLPRCKQTKQASWGQLGK